MIQRIQTLFIFLAFAAFGACFFLPFWNYAGSSPDYVYQVKLLSVTLVSGTDQNIILGTLPIIVLDSVTAILALVSLFYFKNRETQIKIINYNLFITLIFTATIFLWIPYMMSEKLPTADYHWQPGLILPLVAILCLVMANVFIKKDEKLVKSADRLR
jgi:hypothetical protein